MFSKSKTIITEVNDDGVFCEAGLVEVVENTADVFIEAMNGFAESPVKVVEGGDGVFVKGSGFHVVDSVNSVASFADPARLSDIIFVGVRHGLGVVDFLSLVATEMAFGGFEGVVD